MFNFFKRGLKSNNAINPIEHAQNNLDKITKLNQQRNSQINKSTKGMDDRTQKMLERMNRLNGR